MVVTRWDGHDQGIRLHVHERSCRTHAAYRGCMFPSTRNCWTHAGDQNAGPSSTVNVHASQLICWTCKTEQNITAWYHLQLLNLNPQNMHHRLSISMQCRTECCLACKQLSMLAHIQCRIHATNVTWLADHLSLSGWLTNPHLPGYFWDSLPPNSWCVWAQ